ncbi:membrane protein [Kribbella hippodromi]|uniref:Membrane protein n=1 Tax=Kribbella hippodromi TaxID=434347 RepID=A0ABN2E2H4_9ACTN
MEIPWLLVAIGVVLLLFGAYASWTAGRLDRLHARVDLARATLEKELAQRSALAAEVAGAGVLDPASALLLLDAAHHARAASHDAMEVREQAESALTRAIHAVGTETEPWAGELNLAMRRVQLARRFHNDVVVSTRDLRHRRLVTWLRLAGRAPMPTTIELEDSN